MNRSADAGLVSRFFEESRKLRFRHEPCLALRMAIQSSFRDLKVWRDAMALVEEIYVATRTFPGDERFGLTAQIRRAAISIPSNIAEGKRRRRDKPYRNHLEIALGSQGEIEVQLEVALRLGFLDAKSHRQLADRTEEIGKMLSGLIASIRNDESP